MLEGCARLIVVTHPEVGAVVYMFSSVIPAKCRNFSFVFGCFCCAIFVDLVL